MNHTDAFLRLSEFFDGELNGSDRIQISEHVQSCPTCRDQLAAWEQLRQQVKDAAVADCSPVFAAEIREALMTEDEAAGSWSAMEQLAKRTVVGLAFIVSLLLMFVWSSEENSAVTTSALNLVPSDSTTATLLLQSHELTKSDILLATLAE